MRAASSVGRSAAVVRAVGGGGMPSSLTASAAASLRAVGILIEVLDVSSSPSSRSSLIRSIAVCNSIKVMYHAPVVQDQPKTRIDASLLLPRTRSFAPSRAATSSGPALIDVCYDRSGQVQAAGGCMEAS